MRQSRRLSHGLSDQLRSRSNIVTISRGIAEVEQGVSNFASLVHRLTL